MNSDDEKILRLTKEIIIKFIELGRVSPSNFEENFKSVFWTIKSTAVDAQMSRLPSSEGRQAVEKKEATEEEEE